MTTNSISEPEDIAAVEEPEKEEKTPPLVAVIFASAFVAKLLLCRFICALPVETSAIAGIDVSAGRN